MKQLSVVINSVSCFYSYVQDGLIDLCHAVMCFMELFMTFFFLCMCVCAEFRSPSHLSGLNRTASLSGADRTESLSVSGSNSQLNNSIPIQQYTPDFYVRALTDLQFVKVSDANFYSLILKTLKGALCNFFTSL